jgi:hypothetical protein
MEPPTTGVKRMPSSSSFDGWHVTKKSQHVAWGRGILQDEHTRNKLLIGKLDQVWRLAVGLFQVFKTADLGDVRGRA